MLSHGAEPFPTIFVDGQEEQEVNYMSVELCDTFNRQTYFLQGFVPASKSALKKWTKIFHQEMKKKEKAGEKEV